MCLILEIEMIFFCIAGVCGRGSFKENEGHQKSDF